MVQITVAGREGKTDEDEAYGTVVRRRKTEMRRKTEIRGMRVRYQDEGRKPGRE